LFGSIPEGFSIGADGRRRSTDDAIETEIAQKIYSVKVSEQGLVYAWSGTTLAYRADGIPVDLKVLTDSVLQSINMRSIPSFSDFMNIFADKLHGLLLVFIGGAVKNFKGEEIAQAVFFGLL
jgi:hypothetical protein